MDANRIGIINLVERAATELAENRRAAEAAKGPRVYKTLGDAAKNSGWHSDCPRSPLPRLLRRDMPRSQAEAEGYRPTRRSGMSAYVLVATSWDRGYIGRASKTYYSIWGK